MHARRIPVQLGKIRQHCLKNFRSNPCCCVIINVYGFHFLYLFLENNFKIKINKEFNLDNLELLSKDDNTIVYLYTSGSTGKAKLIPKTSMNLIYEVEELKNILSITQDDTFFFTPPLCHIYGFLFGFLLPIYSSSKIILDDCFTPDSIAKFIEKKKITIFISIPTYYRMFSDLNLIKYFINCRKLTSSSAPLSQDVSEKLLLAPLRPSNNGPL